MSLDVKLVIGPLLALVVLLVVGQQTYDSVRRSGTWGGPKRTAREATPDPYARLEAQLARADAGQALPAIRDPFSYSRAPEPARVARPTIPAPPPPPVLTAILIDTDPRVLIRYMGRDYSLKTGDQFAEFKVISISADGVILDRDGQRLALHHPRKGE